MRYLIVLLLAGAASAMAYGQSAKPAQQPRFVLVAENVSGGTNWGGVWRMDTTTGELWRCSLSSSGVGCYPSPNAK